eukprot:2982467-Amphidinium_carterae.1
MLCDEDHACSLPQKALRTSRPDAVLGLDCVRTHLESCLAMDPQRHVNNLRTAIHLHRVSRVCADAYGKMTHKVLPMQDIAWLMLLLRGCHVMDLWKL